MALQRKVFPGALCLCSGGLKYLEEDGRVKWCVIHVWGKGDLGAIITQCKPTAINTPLGWDSNTLLCPRVGWVCRRTRCKRNEALLVSKHAGTSQTAAHWISKSLLKPLAAVTVTSVKVWDSLWVLDPFAWLSQISRGDAPAWALVHNGVTLS